MTSSSASRLRRGLKFAGAALLLLTLTAAFVFRDEVLRSSLDPKQPFQTYRPPAAPDYAKASGWALLPDPRVKPGPADVFFVHPTTYNGGEEWNGPVDHPRSTRQLERVMLPNYAGPFLRLGRVYAPRYRQASVYAMMSLREDAQEARRFAYEDVRRAFREFVEHRNAGRLFFVAGVEQGGSIAERLLREEVSPDPALRARLAGAYVIQSVTSAQDHAPGSPIPGCAGRETPRCLVAYTVAEGPRRARRLLRRALVWTAGGELELLAGRPALCVNPLSGAPGGATTPKRGHLGAANATGLEWGVRPAFLPRQVSARCEDGLLWTSSPRSPSLKRVGGWADRLKAPGFNLFYADLEADAQARLKALRADPGFRLPAAPITTSIPVRRVPLMGR